MPKMDKDHSFDVTYEVINIYRNYEPSLSFTLALYREGVKYLRVDRSQSEDLSKGMIYIGDFIKIVGQTHDGVQIELGTGVHSPAAKEQISLLLVDSSNRNKLLLDTRTLNFLPFLCDILPYAHSPIPVVAASPILKNGSPTSRYQIDGSNNSMIEILRMPPPPSFIVRIEYKTRISMYPNTYNPFFFVIGESNGILIKIVFWREMIKKYSGLCVGDLLHVCEYKNKKKLPFIDKLECNTFTESVYFTCQEITAKDVEKISINGPETLKVNNSSLFNKIEGKVEYLSVIMRYNCYGCLMEYVLCRIGGNLVVLFYNSDDSFYKVVEGGDLKLTEMRLIKRAGVEMYVNTIYSQIYLVEPDIFSSSKRVKTEGSVVFGALGFIPDSFLNTAEILAYSYIENIHNQDVSVNLFMKPSIMTVEEIKKIKLVINESKKIIVYAVLLSVGRDGMVIDFVQDGVEKKQTSIKAVLDDDLVCCVFDNYFTNCDKESEIDRDLLSANIGKRLYFAIDAFRANIDIVIYYITGVFPN